MRTQKPKLSKLEKRIAEKLEAGLAGPLTDKRCVVCKEIKPIIVPHTQICRDCFMK